MLATRRRRPRHAVATRLKTSVVVLPGTAWAHWTAPIAPTARSRRGTCREAETRERDAPPSPPRGGDRDQRRRERDAEGTEGDIQLPRQIVRAFVPGAAAACSPGSRTAAARRVRVRRGRPGSTGTARRAVWHGNFESNPLRWAEARDGAVLVLLGGQLDEVIARLGDDPLARRRGTP